MCQEHERQAKSGSPPHPRCGHGPDDHSPHPKAAQLAEPDAIWQATIDELPASASAADRGGAM